MAKLHIVCIGGTGHKVLTSIIHLAASGAFRGTLGANQINELRVVTIDADDSNGNLSQTRTVLSAYQKFYQVLRQANIGLVNIEPVSPSLNISLYKDDKKSINKTFNIPQYEGSDDADFIRFLYTDDELNAEFDEGFYGHTSIGTLIVKDILKTNAVWKDFCAKINENDFVFVVGSIFGGTGASTIPVVLEELNQRKREKDYKLAVLMLCPYFRAIGEIREDGTLQPDSGNFQIKSKAALYYYYKQEQYRKTDALYIIGEPEQNYSNEAASRGSSQQRNKAHPIELYAVTAFLDFIRESNQRTDSKVITAGRTFAKGEYCYTWKMLQDAEQSIPAGLQRFMKAAVFYNKLLYGEISRGNAAGTWQRYYDSDLATQRDDSQNLLYENLHVYLELFVNWVYDLHKQNLAEIDQNSGRLKWVPDSRVKLFNAGCAELFDNAICADGDIKRFNELVYNETDARKCAAVYSDLCGRPPAGLADKGLAALFATLIDIVSKTEKKTLFFGRQKVPAQETFEVIPYLSKENNVTFQRPDADPNKLWSRSEPKLLIDIADGLPNAISEGFTSNDVSIPSPWSIFIMNELTLTEGKFASLNKTAYNQWCGLLALLVLRKLNLYEKSGLRLAMLKMGHGDGQFLATVEETLPPDSYLFDNPDWRKCYRVSLDDKTLAFLANNILVCPAFSYDAATKTKLNKIAPTIVDENGRFLSPDHYFSDQSQKVNRDSKYALSLFLRELKARVTQEALKNQKDIVKSLQTLLDRFASDLGRVTVNTEISLSKDAGSQIANVYDVFERLCIAAESRQIELPFLLADTIGSETVALIGLNICGISAASEQASTIFVTENLLYNQLNAGNIQSLSGQTRDGVKLIYEDELLCGSMVMIKKAEDNKEGVFYTLPSNAPIDFSYEIVWPVNDKLLDLFTTEKLNSMLSIRQEQDEVVVTLNLKLRGQFKTHTISKRYRIKEGSDASDREAAGTCMIFQKERLPFWAVWPYARVHDRNGVNTWKRYTFFCVELNYRGLPVFEFEPFFTGRQNYLSGAQKLSTISGVINDIYYRRYRELPTAFIVKEKTSGAPIQRGVIFLGEPKTILPGAVEWNVGLDFGTTSTTAFFTTNAESRPAFIQLLTEYNWVEGRKEPETTALDNDLCILSNSGKRDQWVDTYFIDRQCLKQNAYTSTYEKMDQTSDAGNNIIFETGRIFWHNHETFKKVNTSTEGRRERLLWNIKWDTNRIYAGKYLNQLLTQITYRAAERGVRKINLFFSYPTAFSLGDQDDFSRTLNSIVENTAKETGVYLVFDERGSLLTESIAAAFYFRKRNPLQTIFLCVDIGGGTSDVSIWIKSRHVFQTSIRFASRDMFVAPLAKLLERPSVMAKVRPDIADDGIRHMLDWGKGQKEISDETIKFLIETVLFEYYDTFRTRLDSIDGDDDKQAYKHFRYCVLIAYAGLVYYLANIIAVKLNEADPEKRIDNDITQIVFGLSGKGSKLTEWIRSYCPLIYEEAQNLIAERTKSIENQDGLSIEFLGQFSPDTAKTETAVGLICDLDGSGRQKNTAKLVDPEVYLGCGIEVSAGNVTRSCGKDDFVAAYNDQFFANPKALKIAVDKSLFDLDTFVAFFNRIAAKTRTDMPQIAEDWYGNERNKQTLWNKIKRAFEDKLSEGRFDPPFIVMLKVFLEEYSNECLYKNG
jgi:hypothetical protein